VRKAVPMVRVRLRPSLGGSTKPTVASGPCTSTIMTDHYAQSVADAGASQHGKHKDAEKTHAHLVIVTLWRQCTDRMPATI